MLYIPKKYSQKNFELAVPKVKYYSVVYDGWFDLLFELNSTLKKTFRNYKVESYKEKFGSLRFHAYYGNNMFEDDNSEYFNSIISEYELKSTKICEFSGNVGRIRKLPGSSWLKCISDEVYEELDAARHI